MEEDIAYYEELQREQEEYEAQVGFPHKFKFALNPLIYLKLYKINSQIHEIGCYGSSTRTRKRPGIGKSDQSAHAS